MYWRIVKDKVTDGIDIPSRVGVSEGQKLDGDTLYEAKIYDDDGEHYYTVEFDATAYFADGGDGDLYHALRYAEVDAGATDLRIHLDDLAKLHVQQPDTLALFRDRIARKDGWCSIYG